MKKREYIESVVTVSLSLSLFQKARAAATLLLRFFLREERERKKEGGGRGLSFLFFSFSFARVRACVCHTSSMMAYVSSSCVRSGANRLVADFDDATGRRPRPKTLPPARRRRRRRRRRGLLRANNNGVGGRREEEQRDYDRRFQESTDAGMEPSLNGKRAPRGGDSPPEGKWSWTLNWDYVTYDRDAEVPIEHPSERELNECSMMIGSCPRSPGDIDRLIDEAGVEAIVCLQCELCHAALEIDWEPIRKRCLERNVIIIRVAVRDFDRLDQSRRLADMTRAFNLLHDGLGRKTYVHCTAGINRASLTVLGYLTFCQGMELGKALNIIRTCRPQSNPYEVSWQRARKMLLNERVEDLYLYANTDGGGCSKEEGGDWIARDMDKAERGIIKQMFQRSLEADKSLSHALLNLNQDVK